MSGLIGSVDLSVWESLYHPMNPNIAIHSSKHVTIDNNLLKYRFGRVHTRYTPNLNDPFLIASYSDQAFRLSLIYLFCI